MTTEEANFRNLGSSFGHAQFKINLLTYRMVVSCTWKHVEVHVSMLTSRYGLFISCIFNFLLMSQTQKPGNISYINHASPVLYILFYFVFSLTRVDRFFVYFLILSTYMKSSSLSSESLPLSVDGKGLTLMDKSTSE